jgi:hypothetical protein
MVSALSGRLVVAYICPCFWLLALGFLHLHCIAHLELKLRFHDLV